MSFTKLHMANYSLIPYRLYSAPGFLLPRLSHVAFCISERSQASNFRDTRPGCWVACASCGHFETLHKKKKEKQDHHEDIKALSVPKRGGHSAWGTSQLFPFCLAKIIKLLFSISSKLCLHIYIWHQWIGSQDFGNKIYWISFLKVNLGQEIGMFTESMARLEKQISGLKHPEFRAVLASK